VKGRKQIGRRRALVLLTKGARLGRRIPEQNVLNDKKRSERHVLINDPFRGQKG
jgi:hypothetical protein